jgi:hypothetical protein
VVKSFGFKGGVRLFSNRYHFSGGTPADSAHWTTLANAVVAAEKLIYNDYVTIVETVGYAASSDVPVSEIVYSTAGTLVAGGTDVLTPGPTAALARWSTADRSTKNHPIYCFSYWHGVFRNGSAATGEVLATDQRSAMETYATAWVTGFSDGVNTYKRASPNGHIATGSLVDEYLTHRDFPYTSST